MSTITVKVNYGTEGGAPPHRKFHGTTHELKVPETATVEQYLHMVQQATSPRVTLNDLQKGGFKASAEDMQKSVKDCGLKESEIQIWNGMMD